MKIAIINGPNLNLLGKREQNLYGQIRFEDYLDILKKSFPEYDIDYFQSNIEGEIIDAIQKFGYSHNGIILNAAAYTHTSVGIADAIKAIKSPVVEVHISNVWAREKYRHTSYISPYVKGIIAGFGLESYRLALLSF